MYMANESPKFGSHWPRGGSHWVCRAWRWVHEAFHIYIYIFFSDFYLYWLDHWSTPIFMTVPVIGSLHRFLGKMFDLNMSNRTM